jgi:hypothetical protein
MKNVLAVVVCAGFASAAAAQSGSLTIVPSVTSLDTHSGMASLTLSVYGDADFGTAIAGGEFALSVTGFGVDGIMDIVGSAASWGALGEQDNGYSGDGMYDGLIFGQLIFPPFIPAADGSLLGAGPVLLGTLDVTFDAFTCAQLDFTLSGGSGPFVLEVFTDDGADGEFTQLDSSQISFGTASVFVVPSPSSMALLSMAGMVLARRRREAK